MEVRQYRAAGGVVLQQGVVPDLDPRQPYLLVLDRPSRNEVRLPKGHIDHGESAAEAALRETVEEAGYTDLEIVADLGEQIVEFDYANNLLPSFPGIVAPLEELWITWLMKEIALKPTYNAMLRGRA